MNVWSALRLAIEKSKKRDLLWAQLEYLATPNYIHAEALKPGDQIDFIGLRHTVIAVTRDMNGVVTVDVIVQYTDQYQRLRYHAYDEVRLFPR